MSHTDSQGLVCAAVLPLRWQEEDAIPGPEELSLLDTRNEDVLKIVYALDEQLPGGVEETHSASPDLATVEFKLNLLFDLVTQLLGHYSPLPPPRATQLSPTSLEWRDVESPTRGALLRAEIYLSGRYPRPITLFGTVVQVAPCEGHTQITLEISAMGASTREWLEKLIFRHHRRSIAHARRSLGKGESLP